MKNVRKIEDIATKMRLMGDSVEILTESTLIQTPKNGLTHLYKLVDNRLVLSCKYHEIKRVDGADICITKSMLENNNKFKRLHNKTRISNIGDSYKECY